MKMLWMLAAAATLAGCHSRGEDEMGAAPDRGDTTVVDTAMTTPSDTTMAPAMPSDTAMTPTTPSDTTVGEFPTTPTDTTVGEYPAPPTEQNPTPPSEVTPDTSSMGQDSGMSPDTSGYSPSTGDSTDALPADSTQDAQ